MIPDAMKANIAIIFVILIGVGVFVALTIHDKRMEKRRGVIAQSCTCNRFKVRLTPDMYITMKDTKPMMSVRNGFWDMTKPDWYCDSVIIDSFKIVITKLKK